MNTIQAHSQINPLNFSQSPESLVDKLSPELLKVYTIVWKGSAAFLADEPILTLNQITYELEGNKFLMLLGLNLDEEGWLAFNTQPLHEIKEVVSEKKEDIQALFQAPQATLEKTTVEEHQIAPPNYYNFADLIDQMVKQGVARPSTYASSIDRLLHSKGMPYAFLENNRIHLNEKAFEVLSYLEKSAPNIKFDATFSNQLEQDLDRIVAGNVKASDVIKQYIADVIPEAHDIQEQWWIDSLIGEEPEKLMFLEKEEEKQDTLISLKILDVDRYLSPHDPYRLLKLFLDACIENNSNNHILFSTKKDSQHRIIKASVIQSLLNIKCSVVFLTQLRFNYVFQWLVGLEPLHEIWKATVYDKVRHEPIILDATINILNLLKNDDNMLKVTEKLGFS